METQPTIVRPGNKWRVSIRFLLIMICVAALFFAWLSWRLRKAHVRDRFIAEIISGGGTVAFADQFDGSNSRLTPYSPKSSYVDQTVRDVFGTNPFQTLRSIQLGMRVDTAIFLKHSLAQEVHVLRLDNMPATDLDVANFAAYTETRVLDLSHTLVSDQGLDSITGFRHLEELWLEGTQISDRGIQYLLAIPSLEVLDLRRTQISDQGLELVARMPNVRLLYLDAAQVTPAGLRSLKRSLKLDALWLEFTERVDYDLTALLENTTLRDLTLKGKYVNDAMLESLAGNDHIQSLTLLYCEKLTESSIDTLLRIPMLKKVDFKSTSTNIPKEALDRLNQRFPD
jgi:hypothetical protein